MPFIFHCTQTLDTDFSETNRQHCADAARPLIAAVEALTTFASTAEFASVPARISPAAQGAQQPITDAGRSLLDGAIEMVMAAKQLAASPRDPPTYQQYAKHSHSISEAIKRIVHSIR